MTAILLPLFWSGPFARIPIVLLVGYLLLVAAGAGIRSRSLRTALLAPLALCVQFAGYGLGFLKSTILLTFSRKKPQELFPRLFFKS